MSIWTHVEAAARMVPGLALVSPEETAEVAGRFTDAFVVDPESRWWWTALRADVEASSITYGDGDALAFLEAWLPADGQLVLLVTDEEPVPVGAVRGRAGELVHLVGECSYFEYVITDDTASFGILDTHHNVLIRVGRTPDTP